MTSSSGSTRGSSKNKRVIEVESDVDEIIKKLAISEGMTKSDVIREAIRAYLMDKEGKEPDASSILEKLKEVSSMDANEILKLMVAGKAISGIDMGNKSGLNQLLEQMAAAYLLRALTQPDPLTVLMVTQMLSSNKRTDEELINKLVERLNEQMKEQRSFLEMLFLGKKLEEYHAATQQEIESAKQEAVEMARNEMAMHLKELGEALNDLKEALEKRESGESAEDELERTINRIVRIKESLDKLYGTMSTPTQIETPSTESSESKKPLSETLGELIDAVGTIVEKLKGKSVAPPRKPFREIEVPEVREIEQPVTVREAKPEEVRVEPAKVEEPSVEVPKPEETPVKVEETKIEPPKLEETEIPPETTEEHETVVPEPEKPEEKPEEVEKPVSPEEEKDVVVEVKF